MICYIGNEIMGKEGYKEWRDMVGGIDRKVSTGSGLHAQIDNHHLHF
jgi:hypothetical protein